MGRIKRRLEDELIEGSSDGAIKKGRPDWSNKEVFDETAGARHLLSHVEGGYDWSPADPSSRQYVRGYVKGA